MFLTIDESMGTIAAMNGDRNHETECFGQVTFAGETNFISMKGRGNTTWTDFSKKPYNFTVFKKNDYDKKKSIEMIDGVEAKKWSILANAKDPTCLRNKVGYDIAEALGIGLPSRSVDIWMNGAFLGNYLLTPKNDYQVPDEGYMVEIDNKNDVDQFTLSGSPMFTVKEMADDLTVAEVKGSVSKAWDALRQSNSDAYLEYFDLDSWAKMYLLNELYKDVDVSAGSIFFTKATMEEDSKLVAGPVWDLDGTLGRVSQTYVGMDHTHEKDGSGWYIDSITGTAFFQLLGKHASFMTRVYEIYNGYKVELEGMLDDLDTQRALIADSAEMNFVRWPEYMTNTEHFTISKDNSKYGNDAYAVTYQKTNDWSAFTNNLKEYITKRLAFFSDNLTVTTPIGSINGSTTVAVDDDLTLTADCIANSYQWQSSSDGENWTNISGATAKTYAVKATTAMNGLSIRCVVKNTGKTINTSRVAKVAPAATTTLEAVTLKVSKNGFYVAKNIEGGLDSDVSIAFTKSGSNYTGVLYLPGSADTEKLSLSWNGDAVVSVGDVTYASSEAPIPANGTSITYAVKIGNTTANYTVKTMQGSKGIKSIFFNIDESKGTIAAMNEDPDHETNCYGTATFEGKTNYISMKGRGNYTWQSYDKKPYNVTFYKTDDYEGKKQKVELIEGVEAKKWTILTNHTDGSLLRNKLGYDIANQMGVGLASNYIDVWMNGEYIGNYLLTPKKDYQMPDEGYLMELDNFKDDAEPQFTLPGLTEVAVNTNRYNRFTVTDIGDDYTANGGTVKEIEAWMNDVWATICDYGSDDYLDFIDLDSWAKEYILQELYKNYNVICGSILMYREGTDPDDKLIFGPVWDLDGSMGHTSTNPYCGIPSSEQHTADNWYIDSIGTNKYDNKTVVAWLQELGKHESFIKRVYEVYNENKDYFDGEVNGILHNLDVQKELLTDSAAMNFNRWKIDNSSCTSTYSRDTSYGSGVYAITYKKTTDFNSHVENLRTYLTKRLAYLSDNLTVAAPIGTITGATTVAVGDGLTLTADCAADSYQWQSSTDGEVWTNIDGAAGKIYSVTALYSMNGLHIRCVAKNMGNLINTTRVAKAAPAASVILAPVTLTVTLEGHEHSYADVVTTPTCTEKGYTTYTCPCGDSHVDNYTDPLGHNYVDGKCTRCAERDPEYIPECIGEKSASLGEGTLILKIGGNEAGEYTFAQSGNGWTIKGEDGYLGFANNAFAYSNDAFVWTYSNNAFTTTVTTASSSSQWGWGSGYGGWNWGSRNTAATYYLIYANGRFSVSTNANGSKTAFAEKVENMKHSFGRWSANNGVHTRICTECGEAESGECEYGEWTIKDGRHSHTCEVCGNTVSGSCTYSAWETAEGKHSHTCKECGDTVTGDCTYGDWVTDADSEQHYKACSVCKENVYEACDYDTDHLCKVCHREDPKLVQVTASFVTGKDATEAPKAQTVIKGEGKIIKPDDPKKIGYLFDGWQVGDKEFDFNAVLIETVTLTAKWTECTEHEYDENDNCQKCGLHDPSKIPECIGEKSASLGEGTLILKIGGNEAGEYTFAQSGNGWTIKGEDGYLGFANNAFAYSNDAFVWTYSNNAFTTTVTTASSSSQWGWGSGYGGWNWGSRNTAATYYLIYANGRFSVSTNANGSKVEFAARATYKEHSYGNKYTDNHDGTHSLMCVNCGDVETEDCTFGTQHTCSKCGAYDPAFAKIEVSVSIKSSQSAYYPWGGYGGYGNYGYGGYGYGVYGWGGNLTSPTCTATITAKGTGTTVEKVEYSTNNGANWSTGTTFTSNSKIENFLIRITDGNKKIYNFKFINGVVSEVE